MVSAALPLLLEAAEESEVLLAAAPEVAGTRAAPGGQPEPAELPQPGVQPGPAESPQPEAQPGPAELPQREERPWAALPLPEVGWLQAGPQQAARSVEFAGVFQLWVEPVSRSEVEFQASPLVHKEHEAWPSEVWGPARASFFLNRPAVVCTGASPAHIAACSQAAARGRLE